MKYNPKSCNIMQWNEMWWSTLSPSVIRGPKNLGCSQTMGTLTSLQNVLGTPSAYPDKKPSTSRRVLKSIEVSKTESPTTHQDYCAFLSTHDFHAFLHCFVQLVSSCSSSDSKSFWQSFFSLRALKNLPASLRNASRKLKNKGRSNMEPRNLQSWVRVSRFLFNPSNAACCYNLEYPSWSCRAV